MTYEPFDKILSGESRGEIVCGDCLEVMRQMPDECVDLVLTDPPFNKGKDFANDNLPWHDFLRWYKDVVQELHRVLRQNCALLIEVPKVEWAAFQGTIQSAGFVFEYPYILYTTNNMLRGKVGYNHYGLCLWFSKGHTRPRYCYPDVIKAALKSTKSEFSHPSPKNVRHYEKLIDLFSEEGGLIFDPFIGSGTTAVVAKRLGRNFFGCDISKEYVEMALRRIAQNRESRAQTELF